MFETSRAFLMTETLLSTNCIHVLVFCSFFSTVDTSTGESSTSVHNQFTAELTAELSNLAAVAETRSPTQTKSKKGIEMLFHC